MSSCIIKKKDLQKLGKKLMKEFYYYVHEDILLQEDDLVNSKRKYYDENLTKEFLSFYKHKEEKISSLYFHAIKRYKDLVKMETTELLSKIETKIKDETLDIKIIFNFLDQMDMELKIDIQCDFESNEDLFS